MATFKQRDSGYWQAVIRRKGYPDQSKTFEKKADAEKWARDVENKMDRSVFVDQREAEKTTLYDALDRYLKEVTPQKRGATAESYRIKTWQAHKLAQCSLAALRGSDFAAFRDSRLRAGCAASTVQKELIVISHLFNVARREWGFEGLQNPLDSVSKPVANNARDRVFLPGEEERLLAACSPRQRGEDGRFGTAGANSPWLRPAVEFALATAMRQGEVAALLWENVDLKARVALLPMTKNGSARTVPLSSTAVAILEGAKASALPQPEKTVVALPRGPVFKSTANALKIGFSRAVLRARRQYVKECEAGRIAPDPRFLFDFHFHDLRHVATTRLAEKLPNVIELAAVTGHKDLRMLKRYYHPRAEDLARKLG